MILGQLERQDLERGLADTIGDPQAPRLALRIGPPAPHGQAQLEEEELLEDQTHLGRRPKSVQPVHRGALGRKVCLDERRLTVRKVKSTTQFLGQRVVQHGGQPLQAVVNDPSLSLRRQRAGLLVNGDEAPGVDPLLVLVFRRPLAARRSREDFVLRIRELEAARSFQLHLAKQHDLLVALEHLMKKRLVEPDRARHAAGVAEQQLEDLEARPTGRPEMATEDLADHRSRVARLEARDRLKMASIFIPDGKPVEEILDRGKARALQIRRAAGTDALEKLQRHLEDVSGAHGEHAEPGENVRKPMAAVERWERRYAQ